MKLVESPLSTLPIQRHLIFKTRKPSMEVTFRFLNTEIRKQNIVKENESSLRVVCIDKYLNKQLQSQRSCHPDED
jgi:hypothetical protein